VILVAILIWGGLNMGWS